jgi:hypothetical protein
LSRPAAGLTGIRDLPASINIRFEYSKRIDIFREGVMIKRDQFLAQVHAYQLLQAKGALKDIETRIEALPEEAKRREAIAHLSALRSQIRVKDLSRFGWPPLSAGEGRQDLLHSDNQRLVSAVVQFDHDTRKAIILKYVLKERP